MKNFITSENNLFPGSTNPKTKAKCEDINEIVEKWSEIIYFVVAKVAIIVAVLSKAIFCFFIYFTTEFDGDAFELPFPMWLEFWLRYSFLGHTFSK